MMEPQKFAVFLFPSVRQAMQAENILSDREIAYQLIPIPRHISKDCGVCIRVGIDQQDQVAAILQGEVTWERIVPL
jgi:hypothetical protein